MKRVQRMIATITKAEKETRAQRNQVRRATLGYDPSVWTKTEARIRDERSLIVEYEQLDLPPVVQGKHKYDFCHEMYANVHGFLEQMRWAPTQETGPSGVTWIELFIMFDTCGARTKGGTHIKDEKAQRRAEARSSKKKKEARGEKAGNAVIKPSLAEELSRFKAIFRHITRHETKQEQTSWFRMEERPNLRRLAPLGVEGHQPAIAAYVSMTVEERMQVTRNILMQKVGSNPKAMKIYDEHLARQGGSDEQILIKLNRIAGGATVKWKRTTNESSKIGEEEVRDIRQVASGYTSRLLRCTRCQAPQETKWMQLRTKEGYRAIHCKSCGRQERCSHNSCQCGIVWHQCENHRTDPLVHASRKGVAKVAKEKAKEELKLSSTRRAPRSGIQDQPTHKSSRSGNKGHRQKEAQAIRHVKFVASTNKPSDNIIKRLRLRLADQKEAKSNQRREAIARIKPTCHQIEASLMRNAGSKDQSKWNRSHLREYLELKAAKQRDRTKDKLNEELKNSMQDAKRERKWIQGDRVENHFPTNISHAKRKKDSISQDAISRLLKKAKSERQANMSPNV